MYWDDALDKSPARWRSAALCWCRRHDCRKFFDKILSLVDYEEGDILCPYCGSKNVEQRWSVFSAITSKKSA
jgi:RNA polymerase subunit RPABC4/transcription elongation factor Spt4